MPTASEAARLLGSMTSPAKATAARENGRKGGRKPGKSNKVATNMQSQNTFTLKNPWSEGRDEWTWKQIVEWAKVHVHPTDYDNWISVARKAARNGDENILGAMIIGA